ncbi:hypothetical protein U9R90_25030 [Streptomyces sp. E11-3]|uniref:hypothetical protein n=1 Tax=Streptomyces sp. E11-3 TaxID=3110112 RepID=UPI00398021AC
MLIALIVFPMLAMLAAAALVALAPTHAPGRYVLPAVRTVALMTAATAYVVAVLR